MKTTSGVCGTHLIDDKSGIIKRNSLNDAANRRREVDEEAGVVCNEMGAMKQANRGDSTSTILSTDSGVSCFDLESISIAAAALPNSLPPHPRLPKSGHVTHIQQSTIKLNSLSPSSEATITTTSPSSQSQMARLARPEENDDEDYYNDDDLIIDSSSSDTHNKTDFDDSANLNESKLMFRKQNNIRVKQSSDQNLPKHLKTLKSLNLNTPSTATSHQQQQQQLEEVPQASQPPQPSIRKPLIKIKSTTLKNESVRLTATEIPNLVASAQQPALDNFDSTINSAQGVDSSASTTTNADEDSHQRMMLVNLIHATMDAT